jgi:putative MFS transporter
VGDDRFTPYQRKLFIFLSVASFFEGYDFMALSQVLPNLTEDMGLSELEKGVMYGIISAGTIVALLLVRLADKIGRRRVLSITIAGYAFFTFVTGFAPDPITFTVAQFIARIFLIGEWATSMVYAAEEFPAARRGTVVGVIQGFTALGSIVCAGVAPILIKTSLQWRAVYLSAVLPLLLIMYARRNLRETRRFQEYIDQGGIPRASLFRIFSTGHRGWVFKIGALWFLVYLCSNVAVYYWKDFAITERGLTEGQAGLSISIAAVAAMPLVFYAGKLLDQIGRRKGAAVIMTAGAGGTALCYTLYGQWPLTAALVLGIFGASAMLSVLNTITTELFPTSLRADAFAWTNNLIGRIGYVAAPIGVGAVAQVVGEKGPVVAATAIFPMLALLLIFAMIPETRGLELEDTSALEAD